MVGFVDDIVVVVVGKFLDQRSLSNMPERCGTSVQDFRLKKRNSMSYSNNREYHRTDDSIREQLGGYERVYHDRYQEVP